MFSEMQSESKQVNPDNNSKSKYGSLWSNEIPSAIHKSGSVQIARGMRERIWAVFVSAAISSLPALLVGCTLAFPSGALLDLTDLEPRNNFKLDSVLSDVFGVSSQSFLACN